MSQPSKTAEEGYERIIVLTERLRISEILEVGFDLDRNASAQLLAFKTDLSAEVARGILLTTPTDAEVLRSRAQEKGDQRIKVVSTCLQ